MVPKVNQITGLAIPTAATTITVWKKLLLYLDIRHLELLKKNRRYKLVLIIDPSESQIYICIKGD